MTDQNITGRDGFIEAQALIYAIACIQKLPTKMQERSNMSDMCRIARATMDEDYLAYLVHGVESHLGYEVDIFEDLAEVDTAEPSDTEVRYGARYDACIKGLRAARARLLSGDIPETPEEKVIDFESVRLRRQVYAAH